jgi:uncharacterized protein (TIGR02246 family)
MRCLTLLVGGALVLLSGRVFGDEQTASDLVKIGELNESYVVAFNAQDAAKIASLFTANGDFTILTGDALSGREQVAGGHVSFFKNNPKAKISGQQLTARFIRPDVLLATGKWKVENGPREFSPTGLWATVVVKKDGKWQYEAMRLMVPATPSTE